MSGLTLFDAYAGGVAGALYSNVGLLSVFIALTAICAFFLGSIPFGVIVSKLAYAKDIRSEGSGNIGTTNAVRTLGWKGGIITFLGDFLKGLCASLIALAFCHYVSATVLLDTARLPYLRDVFLSLSFCFAVFGHVFSPFLHFHGGKGIAVAIGSLFIVYPWYLCLILIFIFAILAVGTRYVSLGSITVTVICIVMALIHYWAHALPIILITLPCLLILWAHRGNIKRLKNGEEKRFSPKKKDA